MTTSKPSLRASQLQVDDVGHATFFDIVDKKPRKRIARMWKNIAEKINNFLESLGFGIITTLATIYALFADDIRQLISESSGDNIFYNISTVVLAIFSIEILLSSLAKNKYFLSFFFWLDIFSTVSILFDIAWFTDAVFDTGNVFVGGTGAAKLARAAKASRVGSRAARVLKIVRLIRLVRIVKLYKAAHNSLGHEEELRRLSESKIDIDEPLNKAKSSAAELNKNGTLSKDIILNNNHENQNKDPGSLSQKKEDVPLEEDNSPKRKRTDSGVTSLNFQPRFGEESPTVQDDARKNKRISLQKKPKNNKVEDRRRNTARKSVLAEDIKDLKKQPDFPHETNVGRKLTDLTTKRVITLILSVLLTIPIFNTTTYVNFYTSGESGLRTIWLVNQSGTPEEFQFVVQNYIDVHVRDHNPLIGLDILSDKYYLGTDENSLRNSEKQYYNIEDNDDNEDTNLGYAVFSLRPDAELDAILGIVRTIFVTFVLAGAALAFAKDTNDLVLAPMESMLVKVKRIASNPLAAAQIEEEDALICEELEKQGKKKALKKKKDEGNYETSILENTILKLGALLALGFGEAGSNIIAQNMSKGGEVDPMIPGKKVMAIFGFCDIRNFTDATEVLQEGVMVFVNEIAEIVHGTINEYSGAANKNIGDAFLLVWKFPPEEVEEDPDDPANLILKRSIKVSQLADMSIISFLKVMAGVHKSKKLLKYRHNEDLNFRLPNYSVKMGFGLHVGWAIEGAIGSEYKIDASYLSPNVNMAARLEAATKQFGVPVLISGHMYSIATLETKKQLRHIDRVTVKGSNQPIDLYTCDVDFEHLSIEKGEDSLAVAANERKKARVLSRNKRDELREKAFSEKIRVSRVFSSDRDVVAMRQVFTKEFYKTFATGMTHYVSGDWPKAKEMFESTAYMIPGHRDGPSHTLLDFMRDHDFRAPSDWKGFRELTEK